MIKIYQGKECIDSRERKLTRHGKSLVSVDRELIDVDIESLKKSIDKCSNKKSIDNMTGIINYLEKFKGRLNRNDKLRLDWEYQDDILVSKPINILDFGKYNIRMSNYFVVGTGTAIRVTFPQIKDIIAFEIMHNDLDFDFKRIENDFGDIGPIYTYPVSKLYDLLGTECSPYEDSLYMRVDNSPYTDKDNGVIYDYSQRYSYPMENYYQVVEQSCLRVMTQLMDSLIYNVSSGISYKIWDLTRDGFTFYIEDANHWSGMRDELNQSVSVQCVGRRFEIKPEFKKW
jgi:hypothetical protein